MRPGTTMARDGSGLLSQDLSTRPLLGQGRVHSVARRPLREPVIRMWPGAPAPRPGPAFPTRLSRATSVRGLQAAGVKRLIF